MTIRHAMEGETVEKKRDFIRNRLREDLLGADFQWSLFRAAQCSYRFDSVLRPFPPMFIGDTPENKDYKGLERTADKLSSFKTLIDDIDNTDSSLVDLLHWVLNAKTFILKTCSKNMYGKIQKLTGQCAPVPNPTHIFEVVPSLASEAKFAERRGDRNTMFAYHGSRVENFHSILNSGLQSHLNKNALFGEGTYLSSEMTVSMPYAPTGTSWEHSLLGDRVSAVAVCEIIDDSSVKCQVKDAKNGGDPTRSRAANSMAGEVPEKYYIVQNNDMMRLKYVLVYADTSKPRRSAPPSWLYRNRFTVMMILYVLLLICVGLYNSKTFQYQVRRYFR